MEKRELFEYSAIFFFIAILFTPQNSNIWAAFLILAISSGITWFSLKN